MKFLVVGLGSMGKRRVRNLLSLGYNDILGYDIRKDRIDEAQKKYGIKVFSNFDSAISENPDMLIISTSPPAHVKYAELGAKRKIPFFTEVNTEPNDIKKIIGLTNKYKVMGVSSMTMRFHPAVKVIKNLIERKKLGKVYFVNYHSGENLEDWHPWEDVLDYYVGNISTGGGRDQAVFELEWIFWLFGKPRDVMAKTSKLSGTKARIFDAYQMTFELGNVPMANILVDVVQRPPNRILRIVCENGAIMWDWMGGLVRVYDSKTKKWEESRDGEGYKGFNVEEMYQNEMGAVIRSIKEKKNHVSTFENELVVANSVILAEKSSKQKRSFKI